MKIPVLFMVVMWTIITIAAMSVSSPEAGRAAVILNVWLAAYFMLRSM